MTTMPKFNFQDPGITEEEFVKAEKFVSSALPEGTHEVQVVGSRFMGMSDKDPTWMKYRLFYAPIGSTAKVVDVEGKLRVQDGQGNTVPSSSEFVLVPTQTVLYNRAESKRPTAVFANLKKVLAGLGEELNTTTLDILPPLFGQSDQLVGRHLKIVLGYTKNYVKYDEANETYSIVSKTGDKLTLADGINSFDSRDQAIACAAINDIKIQEYIDILKHIKITTEEQAGEGDAVEEGWD
jgi:hypothetical protein